MKENAPGLLGLFADTGGLLEALRQAKAQGIPIREVYSPVPCHEVEHLLDPRPSPVRYVTFTMGLIGCVSGIALAIGTSLIWNMIVGGKPVTAVIPFLVVGFELTILFGAIGTLLALLFWAGLPNRRFFTAVYRPEFTLDRFGVWLECRDGQADSVRRLLEQTGAAEIQPVRPE